MNRGTKLIMSRYLRLRILMPENRQQIDQGKTLCGSSCIRRFAIFIQSAFIADSDTMPVESTHMSTHLRDGTAMVKNSVTGNIKMVTDIKKAPLQMTFAKLFYTEANIAARSAAMNHQQLNLSREILIFRTFHADVLQMSRTGRYSESRNDRRCNCHNELKNILPNLFFHTI